MDVKILAGMIVIESKLSKTAKLQLLNFLKNEASEVQAKVLLLDGKIVYVPKHKEKEINERFELSELVGQVRQAMSAAQSGGGFNIFWLAYRKARSFFDKCTIKCGTAEINTVTRQHCLRKCKMDLAKEEMTIAQKEGKPKKVESARKRYEKARIAYDKSRRKLQSTGRTDVI
jgi:hypothetical protein